MYAALNANFKVYIIVFKCEGSDVKLMKPSYFNNVKYLYYFFLYGALNIFHCFNFMHSHTAT